MKKYIAARPETVKSIIQFGKFPEKLPPYLEGSQLTLFDTVHQALEDKNTNSPDICIEMHCTFMQCTLLHSTRFSGRVTV